MNYPPSTLMQILRGGLLITAIVVPVAVTIMILTGYRGLDNLAFLKKTADDPKIVCFENDLCILKSGNTWYVVTDVINEITVPERLRKSIPTDDRLPQPGE